MLGATRLLARTSGESGVLLSDCHGALIAAKQYSDCIG